MKNIYKTVGILLATLMLQGCGDSFLDTKYPVGVDSEEALENVPNIETATNGIYNRLFNFRFGGNYVISIGDIAGDMATFNNATTHWSTVYSYAITDTDPYLNSIWEWGYKTIDGSAKVIAAAGTLIEDLEKGTGDYKRLQRCIAQASALKGLGTLYLVNIFGLPVKVNGTDNSSTPGVVAIEKPIAPEQAVERTTVGECYRMIVADFERAIEMFEESGDTGNSKKIGLAATEGLLARALLYMENYDEAKTHAGRAIAAFEGAAMIYDKDAYRAMYSSVESNSESIFQLAISSSDNWAANSSGALWTKYGYSPSFAYRAILAPTDIRNVLFETKKDARGRDVYAGGKFAGENGNPAVATHFMVRIPEMYLIIAESELYSASGSIENARAALLRVAKRNSAITSVADLPSDASELAAFIEQERARELFQEGHRFYDLRRRGKLAGVWAGGKDFKYKNFDIAKFCFPIPSAEVNAGFGVEQTPNWSAWLPGAANSGK